VGDFERFLGRKQNDLETSAADYPGLCCCRVKSVTITNWAANTTANTTANRTANGAADLSTNIATNNTANTTAIRTANIATI
jgi:hypothetical protein